MFLQTFSTQGGKNVSFKIIYRKFGITPQLLNKLTEKMLDSHFYFFICGVRIYRTFNERLFFLEIPTKALNSENK